MTGDARQCSHYDRNVSLNPQTQTARELRKCSTPAERHLWQRLRADRLDGCHFRRQHTVGPYVVDFICRKRRVIVEVDGEQHENQVAADFQRTRFLQALGYTVLRFTNDEVFTRTQDVLRAIRYHLRRFSPRRPLPDLSSQEQTQQ